MIALRRDPTRPIGLHWGSRSITMVQLAGAPGHLHVRAMAHGDLPIEESNGASDRDRSVSRMIAKLLADHRFKGRRVASCLGSDELFLQNVRLPQLPPEEVEKVVRWEAEERLPYAVDEAEVRHLAAAEVRQDADIKQEVILMACHRGVLKRHIGILEQAGLMPDSIDVEPCAIVRSLASEQSEASGRHAYVHLGERATAVIFADSGQILFLKYVNRGGTHFDQAVAQHLSLPLGEAAQMRSSLMASATLDTDNEVHRSAIEAIQAPLEALSAEIELCLRYFKVTFRGKAVESIVVTGSDACPWLAEFLAESLRTPCELGNPFQPLSRWPTDSSALERPGRWCAAIGLSLK